MVRIVCMTFLSRIMRVVLRDPQKRQLKNTGKIIPRRERSANLAPGGDRVPGGDNNESTVVQGR